jgi:hypothetical protein
MNNQLAQIIIAAAEPQLDKDVDRTTLPGMVWEIWEDGELTLTKAGPLYGQRSLHMIWPGNEIDISDWIKAQAYHRLCGDHCSVPLKDGEPVKSAIIEYLSGHITSK